MRRWLSALTLAVSTIHAGHAGAVPYSWPTYDSAPGPGGFATVTLEYPTHAAKVKGPDFTIRLRTDNRRAAVLVKLDGKHIDRDCKPFVSLTKNPNDYPQWEFMLEPRPVLEIPVCGVAPGLHVLEIMPGSFGSSLPITNEVQVFFMIES